MVYLEPCKESRRRAGTAPYQPSSTRVLIVAHFPLNNSDERHFVLRHLHQRLVPFLDALGTQKPCSAARELLCVRCASNDSEPGEYPHCPQGALYLLFQHHPKRRLTLNWTFKLTQRGNCDWWWHGGEGNFGTARLTIMPVLLPQPLQFINWKSLLLHEILVWFGYLATFPSISD